MDLSELLMDLSELLLDLFELLLDLPELLLDLPERAGHLLPELADGGPEIDDHVRPGFQRCDSFFHGRHGSSLAHWA